MKLDIHFNLHKLIYEKHINNLYMTTLRLQFGNTILDFVNKNSILINESFFIKEFVYSRLKKRSKSIIIGELLEFLSKINSVSSQMENFFGYFEWVGIYPSNLVPSYINMYKTSYPEYYLYSLREGIITELYNNSLKLGASDWRLLMWSFYEKIINPLFPIISDDPIFYKRGYGLSPREEPFKREVYISSYINDDILLRRLNRRKDIENIFEGLINKGKITPFHYPK